MDQHAYPAVMTAQDTPLLRADQIVCRTYLPALADSPLVEFVPGQNSAVGDSAAVFRIGRIVYGKNEDNLQKLMNVYSAAASLGKNLVMLLISDGQAVELYLGVRGERKQTRLPSAETLFQVLKANFQGSLAEFAPAALTDAKLDKLMERCFDRKNVIASVSAIPSEREPRQGAAYSSAQGMEKLIDTMRGNSFAAIFLADSVSPLELEDIKAEYELLYSALSPYAKSSLTTSDSESSGTSRTIGRSHSRTAGTSRSSSLALGTSKTASHSDGTSESSSNTVGTGSCMHNGFNLSHSKTRGTSLTDTTSFSSTETQTTTQGYNESETTGQSVSDGIQVTFTKGISLQLSYENKPVIAMLERISEQLKRISESEAYGMFAAAAYFIAPDNMTAQMAANTYKSIISGPNTALETAAINSWSKLNNSDHSPASYSFEQAKTYLKMLRHPEFQLDKINSTTPATLISSKELAIQMGLPQKSVAGVSVIETAAFGCNIATTTGESSKKSGKKHVRLGTLYHMGQPLEDITVDLDLNSLAMHTFVTGSTGSGKSNVVYQLLGKAVKLGVKFMVVEPAKGEYKDVFGGASNVHVYGTNPSLTDMLRINPFYFPEEIHILEHLDRLIEIFNVCWPMYAAMPAVLKDAVERAYEVAGWDLRTSVNKYTSKLFPTFQDVLEQVSIVMQESDYSADNKGDYTGALCTRLKSLTNGLENLIFTCDALTDQQLFDENVIIDLSRVGSGETKSLIMGLLVLKLQEYRMSQATEANTSLHHITVLEEAHNLLKQTSTDQSMDGANLMGKSVEMLTNAIAEMRTYGEGFIIADQAPGLLDRAVIRNTNTKIVLRLPELSDRELVGRAIGLNDEQIIELAKLKQGVAAVYQNDWTEAVLCAVEYHSSKKKYKKSGKKGPGQNEFECTLLTSMLTKRNGLKECKSEVLPGLEKSNLPARVKRCVYEYYRGSEDFCDYALCEIMYQYFDIEKILKNCSAQTTEVKMQTVKKYVSECLAGFGLEQSLQKRAIGPVLLEIEKRHPELTGCFSEYRNSIIRKRRN